MSEPTISVVIPLYNKQLEIGAAVRSALAQTRPPQEIIVVDDGSTDGGAEIVRAIGSPLVRLVRQSNAGVCAARNRGIAESTGEYIALLDADDAWEPGFLAEIAAMIREFPGCGLYCTAFSIISHDGTYPAPTPSERGVVANFFRESAHRYIAIPSASCIPRRVFDTVGLFPEGMKIAEDLYMWIRIARRYEVCFSPEPLGGKLHAREDRPFVRGAVRPAGPRGGPGVRGPRRTGKSAYHQRQRRHEGGRPRRPVLRLDANLPPHAAQGPRPERPARRLARSRDPALQRAGLAPRPQRTLILKMMKYLLHTLSCLLLFAAETCLAQTPGHTLRSGGIDRTYRLHLPEGLPDGAPLVIVLHGYGGQGDPERFDMNRVADRHGFAVCYPQGERDGRGKTCWNVGYPFQADMAVDDVRFLSELIRHLQKKHGLSRRNVFCTGMSNGGDMCYLLASRCPETYAALGPVAGFMSVEILRSDRNPHPIPLFEIHGTEDRTTRWEGDLGNEGGWGAYVSVPTAVGYWAAKNKCLAERIDTLPSRPGGLQVIAHRYTEGTDGNEVWLYETVGGKHSWKETGVDTGEELWKFFSRYVR